MTRFSFGVFGVLLRAAVLASAALVAGCGSGAVGAPPAPAAQEPITITPSTATLYSELPSKFQLSGGNGAYIVTSSDQAALPISGTFVGSELTVIPNSVAAETQVVLTVRDTGSSAPVSATLVVRPRTISNVLTITPSASQSPACGTSLCAGGDAEVKAVLSQNGLALANRPVKFEIISGDVRFINPVAGGAETLVNSVSIKTDASGTARIRIRALNNAPAQTAIIQLTDESSGFVQQASVTIAPVGLTALSANPTTLSFQGVAAGTCASNVSADVIVTGGKPPYQASQATGYIVTPQTVDSSGGRFTISPTGVCTGTTTIAIVDSAGAAVNVVVENRVSSATETEFAVSPATVSLNSCTDTANVTLIGGTGNYFASSGNGAVSASANNGIGVIHRNAGGAPGTSAVAVAFSDGKASRTVTVTLSGEALGSCPAPNSTSLAANPMVVTLSSCNDVANISVTGGSGTYSESASSAALQIGGSKSFFTISRATTSTAVSGPQFVDVSDGSDTVRVQVNLTGDATGTCSRPPSNALAVTPNNVTLSECTSSPNVIISGGTGSYTVGTSNTGIQAIVTNNIVTIRRAASSPAITTANACPIARIGTQCVTVSDNFSTEYVGVTLSGGGGGACP